MTAHLAAYGRAGQDPRSIETKSGRAMAVCSMAVELSARDGESVTAWFDLVAFGRGAEELLRHSKGDPIGVNGRLQQNRYTKSDGTVVNELQVVCDAVISARTVRPGGRRRASSASNGGTAESVAAPPASAADREFNDDIPF